MKRRAFNILLGGTAAASAAWPSLLGAQQRAMPVIGWLSGNAPVPATNPYATAFREGLSEAGYVEGRNVAFENRWADGHFDRFPELVADLIGRKVDVIVAVSDPAVHAARNATLMIPIVFIGGDDPVAAGLGTSMARPVGNLTGITVLTGELNPKRLELLQELVPKAAAIALLVNPDNQATGRVIRDVQEATRRSKVQLHILRAGAESEIDAAFATLVELKAEALIVDADQLFSNQSEKIAGLAARHAIPAVYGFRGFAVAGGLISYGASVAAVFRQAGVYTGRILKGAKPADLPIMQPTKFEMVINLKTAKALGITIPQSILARADEVIE
jgi:putative ABC transport system substrate-binding protein